MFRAFKGSLGVCRVPEGLYQGSMVRFWGLGFDVCGFLGFEVFGRSRQ